MTYTIISAAYANEDGSAIVAQTDEAGAVLIASDLDADLWSEISQRDDIAPFIAPPAVAVTATSLQLRLELDARGKLTAFNTFMNGQSSAWRLTWEYAADHSSDHPMWAAAAALISGLEPVNLFTAAQER